MSASIDAARSELREALAAARTTLARVQELPSDLAAEPEGEEEQTRQHGPAEGRDARA